MQIIGTYVFDLNGNNIVDKQDIDIVFKASTGIAKCPANKNCDLNGSNKIDIADVKIINDFSLNYPNLSIQNF